MQRGRYMGPDYSRQKNNEDDKKPKNNGNGNGNGTVPGRVPPYYPGFARLKE